MEYTKLKNINNYKSESINPEKTPDTIFEMYSVPIYETGHPEYLKGNEIASNKAVVKKNDILLCKINPRINRVWVVGDESEYLNIASSEWIVIRNEQYNPEYLAWYFRTPKFQKLMTSEVTGIGGSLTRAQPKCVAEYPVPVLDRKYQDEIVNVLNKCKLIIESRQQELAKLDELIKARFVELFGDPIRNTQNRDTTEFINVVKMQRGFDLPVQDRQQDGEIPVYGSNGALDRHNVAKVQGGGVITGRSGTIGKVFYTEEDYWPLNTSLFSVDTHGNNVIYLAYLLELFDFKRFVEGTGVPTLNRNMFHNKQIINVGLAEQNKFAEFVKQVDKSKVAVQKSLNETQKLFDSLMQEYFG